MGIPDEQEEDITFEERMELLTAELSQQMREAEILDKEIKLQLAKVGFEL